MKDGEKIRCPHCRESSVAKRKPKMDGWTRVGDVLVCALCGAELGAPEVPKTDAAGDSARKLAALLGEAPEPKVTLAPGAEHRRFCRNCRRRVEHPFVLRCGCDGREVDPGDSCDRFAPEEARS